MDIITALMTIFLFLFLFYFLFVHNINPHIRCNCKIDMTARLAANKKKMRSQLWSNCYGNISTVYWGEILSQSPHLNIYTILSHSLCNIHTEIVELSSKQDQHNYNTIATHSIALKTNWSASTKFLLENLQYLNIDELLTCTYCMCSCGFKAYNNAKQHELLAVDCRLCGQLHSRRENTNLNKLFQVCRGYMAFLFRFGDWIHCAWCWMLLCRFNWNYHLRS